MSITISRCAACDKEMVKALGAFSYSVSVSATIFCQTCNVPHEDPRSRFYFFCSPACLSRLTVCVSCGGAGGEWVKVTEPVEQSSWQQCGGCEGRGVVVAKGEG